MIRAFDLRPINTTIQYKGYLEEQFPVQSDGELQAVSA